MRVTHQPGLGIRGSPAFHKLQKCSTPLRFYKRPTFITVFADQKNSEDDLTFTKKGRKCQVVTVTPLSPWEPHQHLPIKLPLLETGCEHLCLILICVSMTKMCPKGSENPSKMLFRGGGGGEGGCLGVLKNCFI